MATRSSVSLVMVYNLGQSAALYVTMLLPPERKAFEALEALLGPRPKEIHQPEKDADANLTIAKQPGTFANHKPSTASFRSVMPCRTQIPNTSPIVFCKKCSLPTWLMITAMKAVVLGHRSSNCSPQRYKNMVSRKVWGVSLSLSCILELSLSLLLLSSITTII